MVHSVPVVRSLVVVLAVLAVALLWVVAVCLGTQATKGVDEVL